jgi:putative peptidoglycan lipid II flippase
MKSPKPQSALRGVALLFIGRIPSRILGLIREMMAASFFGASRMMDSFNIAFAVMLFMRQLFAEQLATPVLPTFFKRNKESGQKEALDTLRALTTRLGLLTLSISVVIFLGAKHIIQVIAPGFSEDQINLTATMVRWIAVGGVAVMLYRYFVILHTCFFRYTVIAFAPLFLNIGAITAMTCFAISAGVVSLAAGLAMGSIGYVVTLILFLPHGRTILKPRWGRGDPGLSLYLMMLLPLFISSSVEHLQLFIDRALASGLPAGALSAQGYALRLDKMYFESIIGIFGTVVFPVFSSLAQSQKREEFAKHFSLALQGVMLVLAFVGAVLVSLALPIIRVLLERGSFTYDDSVRTASLIMIYTLAYTAAPLKIIIIRGFHAHGNTRTPVITTSISACVVIILDFILIKPLGVQGLALALTIGWSLNMILIYILFTKHLPLRHTLQNVKMLLLSIALALLMGITLHYAWSVFEINHIVDTFLSRVMALVVSVSILLLAYIYILKVLRVPAYEYLIQKIRAKQQSDTPPEIIGDE